jgi:hypothetical protein
MKIASTIARYLLGIAFTVFGLNGFLQFLPMQPMPDLAMQFFKVLMASHYTVPIFLIQIVSGLLFLSNQYVPVALTLIGPVIVNILLFHILMAPSGIVPGVIVAICWFFVFYSVRSAFAGIFQRKVQTGPVSRGI